MAKLPLSPSKFMEAWRETSARVERAAGLVLAGDPSLVDLARQRFSQGGMVPATWQTAPDDLTGGMLHAGDVVLVFARPDSEDRVLATLSRPSAGSSVVLAVDEGEEASGKVAYPARNVARLSFCDTPAGWTRLYDQLVRAAGDNALGLGRRYPVLREAAARRLIDKTAAQNALIGLLVIIPGADMPAMTLNQIKMILSLAGLYGQEVGADRALELAGIVGLGFGFRAVARGLLRSVPGIGWGIKAGTGYTATKAVGLAAVRYFEMGAPASTSRISALATSLRS